MYSHPHHRVQPIVRLSTRAGEALRTRVGSRRCGSSGDVAPDGEGRRAGGAVIAGGEAVTTKLKVVVDPAVG